VHLRLACLMFAFVLSLNGCGYFSAISYARGGDEGRYWSKKGFDDEEVRRFYRKCYSRMTEAYNKMHKNKIRMNSSFAVELEIEGQKCMLENGFNFNDASYPDEKLCSKSYAKDVGVSSYMIFPACQAKYGKYKK